MRTTRRLEMLRSSTSPFPAAATMGMVAALSRGCSV